MIFLPKKKIIVDCFTSNQMVYDHFSIAPTKEYIPSWFKKLGASFDIDLPTTLKKKAATVKRCPGIANLFQEGYIIPMWADLILDFKPTDNNNFEYRWEYAVSDPTWRVEVHDSRQYTGLFNNDFFQAKINAPWLIKEKSGIKFLFVEPTYHLQNPNDFTVIPGLLNFKYQNFANINIMTQIHSPMEKNITIYAGQPMVHLIPLTDKKVDLRVHMVSKNEWVKMDESTSAFNFMGSYFSRKRMIDKKCPFRKT